MRPLVIGIAGGTGSGKTTVARNLAAGLPTGVVSLVDHDSYYRDRKDLPFTERAQLNYDHPDSLETELLVEHLGRLRNNEAVEIPLYDFTTHTRRIETRRVEPTPVIVVEGILVLQNSALRAKLDIKIYVDTDADIRVFRRIRRDLEQRARSFESVRDQYYSTVRPMHLAFVEPSRRWADLIIPEGGFNPIALDIVCARVEELLRRGQP